MTMEIVLITGMSGSGKSVALHALEDAGYYCVDNLPPELLPSFVSLEKQRQAHRLAIAIDVRNAASLPQIPHLLNQLKRKGIAVKSLFLDATTQALVQRYSESRRKHPLSQGDGASDASRALIEAIEIERTLLNDLREQAHVIDTTQLRAAQLQEQIKSLISVRSDQLTLMFESFSFKRGLPVEADYVFDVRMLPNPHYEPDLQALTGRDSAVQAFLQEQADMQTMLDHIAKFLNYWLPSLERDQRSYVSVAIGCTGGQHRSVYLVEQLTQRFEARWNTLKRHRELDTPA